jgi:hypothetical protein
VGDCQGKARFGRWAFEGGSLNNQFDSNFSEALLGFNREVVVYCQGLSELIAHEYAMEYTRMLQNRAKGLDDSLPRPPYGLFEPNRNLIRATLEKMSQKYFPSKIQKH